MKKEIKNDPDLQDNLQCIENLIAPSDLKGYNNKMPTLKL